MFENIGFSELSLILIVVLVFFGPKRIPEFSRAIGRGMREFKKAMSEVQDELTKLDDTSSVLHDHSHTTIATPSTQASEHTSTTGIVTE